MQYENRKFYESSQQENRKRCGANLPVAIRLVNLSWTTLSESAGYPDSGKPEQEDDTPKEYFYTLRADDLEFADAVPAAARIPGSSPAGAPAERRLRLLGPSPFAIGAERVVYSRSAVAE